MLLNDFYRLTAVDYTPHKPVAKVQIQLNADHPIYEGHFPGNPIVPGVCLVQMTREIAAHVLAQKLQLVAASNIKFLAVINPNVHGTLDMECKISQKESGLIELQQQISYGTTIAFKFKGVYS